MYGNLPSMGQLADWEFAISQHSAVPQGLLVRLHCCIVLIFPAWKYFLLIFVYIIFSKSERIFIDSVDSLPFSIGYHSSNAS